jgi:hypothetical protein
LLLSLPARPRASDFQRFSVSLQLSRFSISAFQRFSVFLNFQLFSFSAFQRFLPQNSHTLNAYFGTSIARFVYTPFSRLPRTISRFRSRLLRQPFVLLRNRNP